MITLYPLIVRVSAVKCHEAAWELVLRFRPYIKRACYSEKRCYTDEDMESYIIIRLHGRVLGFKVRRFC